MAFKMKNKILIVVLVVIAVVIWYLESSKPKISPISGSADIKIEDQISNLPTSTTSSSLLSEVRSNVDLEKVKTKAAEYIRAKEIVNSSGFINADNVSIKDLVGKKVILVDFWTYSCINCQRTTPYLNAWYEKYKDYGFEIIGIHTPEFDFEKNRDNVEAAVKKFGIKYPVVQDNDYSTWAVYGNRYWPRKYLIDIDGFIVFDHIGEGGYEETESRIQSVLWERASVFGTNVKIPDGIVSPSDALSMNVFEQISPEIYFGAARNTHLGNGEMNKIGLQNLSNPATINANSLYLSGGWNFENEFAENKSSGAKIIFRYRAKNVYMVASSVNGVGAKVLLDGKPLGAEKGADIVNSNGQSALKIKEDRLYKLIEDPAGYGEHTLEIIIDQPGLKSFTFTFG
jgi:thiol-disulfide isomerase/thioredoxin